MGEDLNTERDPDRFIVDHIETVPHLEALLILWRERAGEWSVDRLASRLFLPQEATRNILTGLIRHGLIRATDDSQTTFVYADRPEDYPLMEAVDITYRKDLVRISHLIHSRPAALRSG